MHPDKTYVVPNLESNLRLCLTFADVFVGIGPRFTAVEPSRVAPQCLQGLRKYHVFSASKGGREKGTSKFG